MENHREAILKNPIVRALGGDATAVDHDLSVIDHFDHDNKWSDITKGDVIDSQLKETGTRTSGASKSVCD